MPNTLSSTKKNALVCAIGKNFLLSRNAFGLVEVILGMFILTTALTVVMLPAIRAIQYTAEDRKVVAATYLMQEGLEVTRNVRDNRFAKYQKAEASIYHMFSAMSQGETFTCFPRYDYTGNDLFNASNGALCGLGFGAMVPAWALAKDGAFFRAPVVGEPISAFLEKTAFLRKVTVKDVVHDTRYDIVSYVTWGSTSPSAISGVNTTNCTRSKHCVFSSATLTNWDYWSVNP